MSARYPFAPGVIDAQARPARFRLVIDFAGALALVALAFFLAGWLL